jgi:hypothetical protein
MKYIIRTILIFLLAAFTVGSVQAQKKKTRKKARTQKTAPKKKKTGRKTATVKPVAKTTAKKTEEPTLQLSKEGLGDTSSPKVVTITSAFKPYLKNAAKVNFTAATPVIDSSRMPVTYTIPSQNLFFSYQPVPIKPLALGIDSGYEWENHQYIKVGAGNFSTYLAEAAFSFGDGQHAITQVRADFLTSTGYLYAQQAAKWGLEVISVFNTASEHEWTANPYYRSSTQYRYGFEPATLIFPKDQLLERYSTIGVDLGMQNKKANAFGITYHPQLKLSRFFNNSEAHENSIQLKAPINKTFGEKFAFDLGLTADMSTARFPMIPNERVLKNNLYYVNPSIQVNTATLKLNLGVQPSWDNKVFAALPNLTVQAKMSEINLILEAGWVGYFQKNSFRSLAGFNPWIGSLSSLQNTRITEQYAGIRGVGGDHFTYQVKASLLQYSNQPLFLNNNTDGKSFDVVYEPDMKAVRLHGEMSYTVQENISFSAGASFTDYRGLTVQKKAWGLLPLEANGSVKWKLLKDLLLKADLYLWDGSAYRTKTMEEKKGTAAADINLGAEFTVMPRLNLWLQANNVLNSTYQRWNQYSVLGFTILGGVVYSFR